MMDKDVRKTLATKHPPYCERSWNAQRMWSGGVFSKQLQLHARVCERKRLGVASNGKK